MSYSKSQHPAQKILVETCKKIIKSHKPVTHEEMLDRIRLEVKALGRSIAKEAEKKELERLQKQYRTHLDALAIVNKYKASGF